MINTHKYCINCENEVGEALRDSHDDFCSPECAEEYAANADPELLNRARNTNPDALPITQDSWTGNRTGYNSTTGNKNNGLPPNNEDAIASMLKIGGVSQADIDKVLQTKSSNESEPK